MSRYKIYIEYDGTQYAGWQSQPEQKTVQGEIEAALCQIWSREVSITASGRTDSGVHAEGQVAHFDVDSNLDINSLLRSLYGVLPRDIAVWKIEAAQDDFHARFDAVARQYRYQIVTRPSPLLRDRAWERFFEFDMELMEQCAYSLLGIHDFSSFCRYNPDVNHTKCDVLSAELLQESEAMFIFRIKANRFLHHMVRSIVGTIIEVGLGKRPVESFQSLLEHPDRREVGVTAPARGLILEKVFY